MIAIALLAVLTAVASGTGLSAGALALMVLRLALFLAAMLTVGMLVVPRLVRMVVALGRIETTVVSCVGVCFAPALVARSFGYSVALDAFIGGDAHRSAAGRHPLVPIVVLSVVVIVGKVLGVTIGSFIAGNGIRTSIQSGMSFAQIGEYSFIIVGVGLSLGVVREFFYPGRGGDLGGDHTCRRRSWCGPQRPPRQLCRLAIAPRAADLRLPLRHQGGTAPRASRSPHRLVSNSPVGGAFGDRHLVARTLC